MLGKLIILGVVIVALFVFIPNLYKMIGAPSLDAVKQRIDSASNTTNSTTQSTAGNTNQTSITPISVDQLDPKYVNKQTYTGQVFSKTGTTCDVSVPTMAETINGQKELTHIIEVEQCSYSVGKPVQVTLLTANPDTPQPVNPTNEIQIVPYADPNSSYSTLNTGNQATSASASGYPSLPPYYQVINLNAQNEGSNVSITYDDTTGKTTSVTVTLRNSDQQIFSGTFTSSQFQTEVKDVPNTPHMIDMTVQNSEYGTLHGSVYAPSNIQNSTIAGIFTGP